MNRRTQVEDCKSLGSSVDRRTLSSPPEPTGCPVNTQKFRSLHDSLIASSHLLKENILFSGLLFSKWKNSLQIDTAG